MSAFHVLPRPLTYEEYAGLVLQLDRARYQRAAEGLLAHLYAVLPKQLPDVWFEAMARFTCDIGDLRWFTNAPRADAEMRANRGR